ncbi:hypothetical protein F5Y19DRAFT_44021 [Xylariaceae sp. FL1651]|nr:hypothetical protein F5Y19DRAFT_44021 [Xylariaceae sp. FL1651]
MTGLSPSGVGTPSFGPIAPLDQQVQRPAFHCSLGCGRSFERKWDLQKHKCPPHTPKHYVACEDPFKCKCGQQFTKLYTLERHIRGFQRDSLPAYPCEHCSAYQGTDGFKRKDHLLQHLRVFHKYDASQLAESFAPRKARIYNIPVCHFNDCEYFRGPEFKALGAAEQENNRPFTKQSDYTAHMKQEHDWSPYPCNFPGCRKVDRNGFFSPNALNKHFEKNHPEATAPQLETERRAAVKVTCDYCRRSLLGASLAEHQLLYCPAKVKCDKCRISIMRGQLWKHYKYGCT